MKTFKETDDLSEIREGDRLEMNDGCVHLAVSDKSQLEGEGCSMTFYSDQCLRVQCATHSFHFEKIETDE